MTIILQTRSGQIDLDDPRPEDIRIDDIAWSLAHLYRWTGHRPIPISVARHSIHVMQIVHTRRQNRPQLYAQALMHDAAEAFLGDINRPVRSLLGESFSVLESRIERVIAIKWSLGYPFDIEIRQADDRACLDDHAMWAGEDYDPRPPHQDAWAFLMCARKLGIL